MLTGIVREHCLAFFCKLRADARAINGTVYLSEFFLLSHQPIQALAGLEPR
jgi:hypothetical protein